MTIPDSKPTLTNNPESSHLLVIEEVNEFRKTINLQEASYSIGRDSKNTIVLSSKKISRYHATLLRRTDSSTNGYSYWILDGDLQGNRSTNGIFVNDKRCLVQSLKHGDVIKLGLDITANYYITSNLSDAHYLKSGDFENLEEDDVAEISKDLTSISKKNLGKQTVIIPESESDKNDNANIANLASFPELSPHPIIEISYQGEITYINPAALKTFKAITEDKLEHPVISGLLVNLEEKENHLTRREIEINQETFEEYIHYLPDKKLIRIYVFDTTKRKKIEAEIRQSEQLYRLMFKQTSEKLCIVDGETKKILQANNSFADLLEYSETEIVQLTLYDIWAQERQFVERDISKILRDQSTFSGSSTYVTKSKKYINVKVNITCQNLEDRKILCLIVNNFNQDQDLEEYIDHKNIHDLITGLPNRTLFQEQFATALANSRRNQSLLAIMLLNLDYCQNLNDTLGYGVGDRFLRGIAKRIRACLRGGDTVGRWGGYKFAILLPQVSTIKDIAKIAKRILQSLRQPFDVTTQQIYIRSAIGIALFPQDEEETEILLEKADAALYRCQEKGWNKYEFYSEEINKQASKLLKLENILISALDQEEFSLVYQPYFNIKTKKITGIEALVRWQHPELGEVTPKQFIPLAEDTGLIVPIGEWILKKACQQNANWQKKGLPKIPVTVNLSPRQFQQPNLVSSILQILDDTQLEPKWLELEITENIIINNMEFAHKTMGDLKKIGIRLSLDDFGIGYSALGYLKQFPFSSVKIDSSLIKQLHHDSRELTIVNAIIGIGKDFNLNVIAEGVETKQQVELLENAECEQIQGNFFSKALTGKETTNFLSAESFIINEKDEHISYTSLS